VNSLVLLPSCCICWKICIAFLGCPSFTYLLSFVHGHPESNKHLGARWFGFLGFTID
jgi:hypothetical protein